MKFAERTVLLILVAVLVGGFVFIYSGVQSAQEQVRADVVAGKYERPLKTDSSAAVTTGWRHIYPFTIPITIGDVSMQASVADTMSTRIKGLSDTPFLPPHLVKLFVFGTEGEHAIWMKDMNYPLDILWAAKDGTVVHIEENVSHDSYPQSFSSSVPAWFVIEANAGFVASSSIVLGDKMVLHID